MTMGPLLIGIYVFVLAIFVGFELISKVPPTLHTPLMSGANAISGITIVVAHRMARAPSRLLMEGSAVVADCSAPSVNGRSATARSTWTALSRTPTPVTMSIPQEVYLRE